MINNFDTISKHQGSNGAWFCDDCGGMVFKGNDHVCIIPDAVCPICGFSMSDDELHKIGTCEECDNEKGII